tara:strand:+ start:2756 stop:3619 length:864 start_codon:yes stop_codon:yes gene_type:complete
MTNKHNKKRNVGIIYELLLRHMSNCLIEKDYKNLSIATKLIEKRFHKKSELYKEFRLFNAIANTHIDKTELISGVLTEAKAACKNINKAKLIKEKSALIKDINYNIKDRNFYYRNIPNYVDYANIQNLLNEWQKINPSITKLVEFESKIIDWLKKPKESSSLNNISETLENNNKSDKLVFKIMSEKFNKKYNSLNAMQKEIIKNYAFYKEKNSNLLKETLVENKKMCLKEIDLFEKNNSNKFLSNKINTVKDKIMELNTDSIDEKSIVKFLTLTNLLVELKSGDINE